jgi:general secretion pathway protein D
MSVPARSIKLATAFSLLLLLPLCGQAQDSGNPKDKPKNQTGNGAQKSAETAAPAKAQEEYYEIVTPFGIQKYPKKQGAGVPAQSAPAASAPAAAAPSASAPGASGTPAAPATQAPAGPASQPQEAQPPQQTPPTPPPATTRKPAAGSDVIGGIKLSQVDLHQFINIVGSELKLNYVIDPAVKGSATIMTAGELRRDDLLPLLEAVLRLNGASIVKTGNFYQIVPSTRARQLPLSVESQAGGETSKADPVVMQIIPMRFVSVVEMSKILTPFLSDGGSMVVHEGSNILIITDSSTNVKKLLQLVNVFDADIFHDKRVQVFPLKNGRAKNLIADLQNIFAGYGQSSKDSAIRFVAIDRINSVLAVSSNSSSLSEVAKWIDKLDQPVASVGLHNFVYKVENSDAKNIARLLIEIYGGGRTSQEKLPAMPGPGGAMPASGAQEPEPEKVTSGVLQGDIRIVADELNNAVIVQSSAQDYETIKETIQELDRIPRQVLIEAKIYEVKLTGAFSFGISAYLQKRQDSTFRTTTASFASSGTSGPSLIVNSAALIGNYRELVAVLNAQENRSRTRVLSTPSILASDNISAKIQVGDEVPMLTSQGLAGGGSVGGTSLFTNTIQNRSTGVILNVTPRINPSGWVTLKIQQEVSQPVAPTSSSAIQSPSISVRSVQTQATVKDGETIAIAGIITESKLQTKNRIPVVGDIPGLGFFFGNTSYSNNRTELVALITPHVIQDLQSAIDVTEELKSTLKGLSKELRRAE